MAKFIPLVDKNTKVVYEWRMVSDDGSEERVTLFREQWKAENAWTRAELEQLFSVDEAPALPEEEALDDAPLFSRDFSTPGDE